jgi:DNA polymerase I-like protein with 3'-5' exonuclease and polymerase domains
MWIGFIVDAGLQPSLSMHDEVVIIIKDNKEEREKTKKILEESMEKVNNIFNFAARISIDVQFGKTYADIH